MTIENLTGLIRGEILNSPRISAFEGFCFEAKKVQRGDLYIAIERSSQSIEEAVQKGAYGILIDEEFEIIDKEIVWIRVENINMAIMRLMRFQSSYKKLKFVALSHLQQNILKSITLPMYAILLPSNIQEAFLSIMRAEDQSYVFCSDDIIIQKIAPIHESIFKYRNITTQKNGSIFISSFIYDNEYYQKIPISPLFVTDLCGIFSFLKEHQIQYSIDNFKPIENFEPIFVDASIYPQHFGTTRRALIVESDMELFKFEAKTLLKTLPQNSLLICKHIDSKSSMDANFLYKDESELKQLRYYNFRYALILGDKTAIIEALMEIKAHRYPSLFGKLDD